MLVLFCERTALLFARAGSGADPWFVVLSTCSLSLFYSVAPKDLRSFADL